MAIARINFVNSLKEDNQDMLDGKMEQELSHGEAWCPWQSAKLLKQRSHSVEPDRTVTIYEEVLQNYIEQVKTNQLNCSSITSKNANGLYQWVYHYCHLLIGER